MNLEEKLYTSTEVAEILGVSLRSVYRYLDEDKLRAEVKTATGRHRFTKQNILDFLYPQGNHAQKQKEAEVLRETSTTPTRAESTFDVPSKPLVLKKDAIKEESAMDVKTPIEIERESVVDKPQPVPVKEEEEEPIDWLEKFRAAANKYKEEEIAPKVESINRVSDSQEIQAKHEDSSQFYYYRSLTGGLKDIAQNIDKSARKASIDYAFTMNAGLSLHKPIKPFSILHVYVRSEDREFFERMLHLVPAEENSAQLSLLVSGSKSLFNNKIEMHGLFVVSDMQLKKDLMDYGEEQLAKELEASM
jgi:hypothetical protein